MKKLLALTVSMLGLAAFGGSSQAQNVVSVQFPSYYSAPYNTLNGSRYGGPSETTTAGVVSEANWNDVINYTGANTFQSGNGPVTGDLTQANVFDWVTNPTPGLPYANNGPYTSSPGSLIDSNGANSSVTFTLGSADVQRGNNNQAEIGGSYQSGDSELASGGALNYGGTTTLSVGNLNATDSYDLIAYLNFDYYSTDYLANTVEISGIGSTPLYALSGPQSNLTAWTPTTATSAGTAVVSNYVEFDGLSGTVLEGDTLSVNGGAGFSGFQLVDNGALVVPEPSTWAMMLGGLGMLAFCVRRKAVSLK